MIGSLGIIPAGRRRSAGGAALPDTMALHLDASQLSGYSDSDTVTNWNDLSGNGRDYTTLHGTPSYQTGIQNGLPGVLMNSGEGFRVGASGFAITSGDFSCMFVGKLNSNANAARRGLDGSLNWLLGPFVGTWQVYTNGYVNSGVTLNTTDAKVFLYTHSGSTAKLYTDATTFASRTGTLGWPGTIGIGHSMNNESFLGYGFEIAFWLRVLDSGELANAFDYASAKWATG